MVATMGVLALPALADWHGRGGYYGGPRVSVGIGICPVPLYAPSYYYAPAPVYYAPRPVVVGREVGGGGVVVDVQRSLGRKGYYHGAVDGDLGPQTRAAIREWQADCRMPVTGQLDTPTLRSLALL